MISRRDFLKSAGVAALAVATTGVLAGCSAKDTPVTPDPAPAPNPSTGSTYALGQAIPVADGVTVTITGKRYNFYNANDEFTGEGWDLDNFGFIALKVNVNNESDKAFEVKSTDFRLVQTDYKPRTQYPLNVRAYGVADGTIADDDTAGALEYLVGKFAGTDYPPMDYKDEEITYVLGTPGTELAAHLGFVTNVNEAEGTATLQYVVGDKVYKINF